MKTGNALHCDAHAPLFCRSGGNVTDVKKNLYDGDNRLRSRDSHYKKKENARYVNMNVSTYVAL